MGCSRLVEKEAGVSINLNLTKSSGGPGAQSIISSEVRHLVVNVDGPESYFMEWDFHDSDEPLPTTIEIELDPGSYLIQIAAYVESNSGGGFVYGDSTVGLTSGTRAVSIATSPIGTSTGLHAWVAGRYLSSGELLNGSVTAYFSPPGGKPAMPILKTEIFAGWFNFFAIDGVAFEYVHDETGLPIFNSVQVVPGSPPDVLLDGVSLGTSSSPAHFVGHVPSYLRNDGTGMGDPSSARSPGVFALGYFGPGVTTEEACPYTPSGMYSDLYQVGDPMMELEFDFNSFDAAFVSRVGTSGITECAAATDPTPFSGHLYYEPTTLETTGFQSSSSVQPPFKFSVGFNSVILPAPSGSNIDINFGLLPDVFDTLNNDPITSIDVYVKNDDTIDLDGGGLSGPSCEDAAAKGFVLSENVDEADCPTGDCLVSLVGRDSNLDYEILLCPKRWGLLGEEYTRAKAYGYAPRDFVNLTLTLDPVSGTTQDLVMPNTPALNCRLFNITPSVALNYELDLELNVGGTAAAGVYAASDTSCAGTPLSTVSFPLGSAAPVQVRIKGFTPGSIEIMLPPTTVPEMASSYVSTGTFELSSGYQICVSSSPQPSCGVSGFIGLKFFNGGSLVANESGRPLAYTFSGTEAADLDMTVCSSFNTNMIATGSSTTALKTSSATGVANLVSSDPDVYVDGACTGLFW